MDFAQFQPLGMDGLPFVNWIFLGALSSGTLLTMGLTEWLGGTTVGYHRFMASAIALGSVAWLISDLNLTAAAIIESWMNLRRLLVWGFVALAMGYLVATWVIGSLRTVLAVGGGLVGLAALLVLPLAGATAHQALLAAGLGSAALALGSVTAGMLLGHWYLVTPRLSPAPLRRLIWLLIGALSIQGLLVAWSVVVVGGVVEPPAWLTVLRFGVGIVFPLGISVLALMATNAPSLQATTGLLYVGLAAVIAGTIGGASLVYFGWAAV